MNPSLVKDSKCPKFKFTLGFVIKDEVLKQELQGRAKLPMANSNVFIILAQSCWQINVLGKGKMNRICLAQSGSSVLSRPKYLPSPGAAWPVEMKWKVTKRQRDRR